MLNGDCATLVVCRKSPETGKTGGLSIFKFNGKGVRGEVGLVDI